MIAERYARAVFQFAREAQCLKAVEADFRTLGPLLEQSEALRGFFSDPTIPSRTKQQIIQDIFEGPLCRETVTALRFLIARGREGLLREIIAAFLKRADDHSNVVGVTVRSRYPLNRKEHQQVQSFIRRHMAREARIREVQDRGLIGGVRLQAGDRVFDFSLQGQLERFRDNIFR